MMNKNTKSFMIKNIPAGDWKKFKIKFLQNGFNTYNEALLDIIVKYSSKGK